MINKEFFFAAKEQNGLALGIILAKFAQRTKIIRTEAVGVFDFDGVKAILAVENKINFDAAARAPEEDFVGMDGAFSARRAPPAN